MKKLRQKLESCHLKSLHHQHSNKTRSTQMSSLMLVVNFQLHKQHRQPKQQLRTKISRGRYRALDAQDSTSFLKQRHLTVPPSLNALMASYSSMVAPQSLTYVISTYSQSRTSRSCSCPHFKSCMVRHSWQSILNSEARST